LSNIPEFLEMFKVEEEEEDASILEILQNQWLDTHVHFETSGAPYISLVKIHISAWKSQ